MAKKTRVLAVAILLGYIGIIVRSQRHEAVTFNEFAHLPAGIAYWRHGAFSIYNVNPPLSKLASALPALAAKPALPSLGSGELDGSNRPEWEFGLAFLQLNRHDYRTVFALGRSASALFLAIGAWCVWRWSRDLHGSLGGAFSLALYVLCPNLLAAGQFVTPDAATTALMLVACYSHWRWLKHPSPRLAIWSGLALGVAELCKYTALLLYPVWCATWAVAFLRWRSTCGGGHDIRRLAPMVVRPPVQQIMATFAVSIVVINAGYAFQDVGCPLGELPFRSMLLTRDGVQEISRRDDGAGRSIVKYRVLQGNRFSGSLVGGLMLTLPRQYLLGIDVERCDFENAPLPSYLRGRLQKTGWWYFYLYALAVKLPLGTIVAVFVSLACCPSLMRRQPDGSFIDALALLSAPAAVLVVASLEHGVAQSVRYVVPALPPLFIAAGALGRQVLHTRLLRAVMACCLVVNGFSVARTYPHFLAYFNEWAGGPSVGARHLLFSNLDWGQDLLFLKEWIDEHPEATPLGLAYFHFVDPAIERIAFHLPPVEPTPGWYAVSANFVYGMGFSAWDGNGRRRSIPEGTYRYFQDFKPIGMAGYSIYLYHVNTEDAQQARERIGLSDTSSVAPSRGEHSQRTIGWESAGGEQ